MWGNMYSTEISIKKKAINSHINDLSNEWFLSLVKEFSYLIAICVDRTIKYS
jgi:hypothetical protein